MTFSFHASDHHANRPVRRPRAVGEKFVCPAGGTDTRDLDVSQACALQRQPIGRPQVEIGAAIVGTPDQPIHLTKRLPHLLDHFLTT